MQAAATTHVDIGRAGRAMGAMSFFGFGGAWLEFWAQRTGAGKGPALAIAMLAVAFVAFAWLTYRRHAAALAGVRNTARRRHAMRIFHIVNVAQWAVIVGLAFLLPKLGLTAWVIPADIVVVGLHLVPLAHVFRQPAHYVTAAAMSGLGVLYPFLAHGGPLDPVGLLGTGLILWVSAAWAVRPGPAPALP